MTNNNCKTQCSRVGSGSTRTNSDGTNTCTCMPGYSGECCDKKNCKTQCSRVGSGSSRSNSDGTNTCTCMPGYSGECCDTKNCLTQCSPSGSGSSRANLDGTNTCTCMPGYRGECCDVRDVVQCTEGSAGPCLNGGTPTGTVPDCSCTCLKDFSGEACETLVPVQCTELNSRLRCLNGGTPTGMYPDCLCACPANFTGVACEIPGCTEGPSGPCLNGGQPHGTADSGCSCICPKDFSGKSCENPWDEAAHRNQVYYCGTEQDGTFSDNDGFRVNDGCKREIKDAECEFTDILIADCPDGYRQESLTSDTCFSGPAFKIKRCVMDENWKERPDYMYCGNKSMGDRACSRDEGGAQCVYDTGDIAECPSGYSKAGHHYNPSQCSVFHDIQKCCNDGTHGGTNMCDVNADTKYKYCGEYGCFNSEHEAECSFLESDIAPCPTGYKQLGDKYSPRGCAWSWNIHSCIKDDPALPPPTYIYCGKNGCFEDENRAECSYWENDIEPCPYEFGAGKHAYSRFGDKYSGPGCAWSFNIHKCRIGRPIG